MKTENQPASQSPAKSPVGSPVRPRDAASIIIFKQGSQGPEVLLGKRPTRSSFMPDVYVFPGGGVEAADARAKPATGLDARMTARMAVANSDARAQTLAMAAIRETYEEVGLMISRPGLTGSVKQESWRAFSDAGQAADLSSLRYVGRAITPTQRAIRFHARFFACDVASVPGLAQQPLTGNGELLDLQWVNINATGDLPLRSVTTYMLEQFAGYLAQADQDWIGDSAYLHKNGKLNIQRDC